MKSDKPSTDNYLIDEAIKIAEQLITQLEFDDKGCFWKTVHYDPVSETYSRKLSINILNGAPGIILFILDLYNHTKDISYLVLAKKATIRLIDDPISQSPDYFTFYTGSTGLIYLCIKLYETSKDMTYLDKASSLAMKYADGIKHRVKKIDMLSGDVGNLLVLTYLYHFSASNNILELINFLTNRITSRARPATAGVKWMDETFSVDSLIGYSHGNSGIAHGLIQVGNYFNNKDLIWMGEQGLAYEMTYFVKQNDNWMDLRLLASWLQTPDVFRWDLKMFQEKTNDINAWAHGAAGIGLTRLHAFLVTGNKVYLKHSKTAIRRSLRDFKKKNWINYALLNGFGGIAELLMLSSKIFKDKQLSSTAQQIAMEAIDNARKEWASKKLQPHDLGLFTGLSGIGYLLLGVISGHNNDSVAHPVLPVSESHPKNSPLSDGYRRIHYSEYFKITTRVLRLIAPEAKINYEHNNIQSFANELRGLIRLNADAHYRPLVNDAYKFETFILRRWQNHKGRTCFRTRVKWLSGRNDYLVNLEQEAFIQRRFVRTPLVVVYQTQYEWQIGKDKMEELKNINHQEKVWNIIYDTESGVGWTTVNSFAGYLLMELEKSKSVQELAGAINIQEADKSTLQDKIVLQLKALLDQYFIMEDYYE